MGMQPAVVTDYAIPLDGAWALDGPLQLDDVRGTFATMQPRITSSPRMSPSSVPSASMKGAR